MYRPDQEGYPGGVSWVQAAVVCTGRLRLAGPRSTGTSPTHACAPCTAGRVVLAGPRPPGKTPSPSYPPTGYSQKRGSRGNKGWGQECRATCTVVRRRNPAPRRTTAALARKVTRVRRHSCRPFRAGQYCTPGRTPWGCRPFMAADLSGRARSVRRSNTLGLQTIQGCRPFRAGQYRTPGRTLWGCRPLGLQTFPGGPVPSGAVLLDALLIACCGRAEFRHQDYP